MIEYFKTFVTTDDRDTDVNVSRHVENGGNITIALSVRSAYGRTSHSTHLNLADAIALHAMLDQAINFETKES